MKLNKIEFFLMNNPLRDYIQEKYELPVLRRMTTLEKIDSALEIGCGNGNGTKLIKKYFSANRIVAIDLDEKMIEIAKKNNCDPTISFHVMDASKLEFQDNTFDAIFDFGIIHHIPFWRECIWELKRVLKKDGEIILEELSKETFSGIPGNIWKALLDHPYEEMFSQKEFVSHLKDIGFTINDYKELNPLKLIKHFSLSAKLLA